MDAILQCLTYSPWNSKLLSLNPETSIAYYVEDLLIKSQTQWRMIIEKLCVVSGSLSTLHYTRNKIKLNQNVLDLTNSN